MTTHRTASLHLAFFSRSFSTVAAAKVAPTSSFGDRLIFKSYAETYAGGADVIRCEGSQAAARRRALYHARLSRIRFEATATSHAWIYRQESPVDGQMRQVTLGEWPAMSVNAARMEEGKLRDRRATGLDMAAWRRAKRAQERNEKQVAFVQRANKRTVHALAELYLTGQVARNRKNKGADETRRTLGYALRARDPGRWSGEFGELDPAQVTRAQAFALLQMFIETPVQAGRVRLELGATWDYGHDCRQAGRRSAELVAPGHARQIAQQGGGIAPMQARSWPLATSAPPVLEAVQPPIVFCVRALGAVRAP